MRRSAAIQEAWALGRGAKSLVLAVAYAALLHSSPANADLKLCNATVGRIGVSIGYRNDNGWATEGWWTIPGQTCEVLLKGRLGSRFYYVHAIDYDRGGEWSGSTQMCTGNKTFTIKGNDNCEGRGHARAGFMEVDTNEQRDWTIRLTDPVDTAKPK